MSSHSTSVTERWIRTTAGVETPAPGCWRSGHGETVEVDVERRRRCTPRRGRLTDGSLVVEVLDDDITIGLELEVDVPGHDDPLRCVASIDRVDASDIWQLVGTLELDGSKRPATVVARYNGVFRRPGGRALVWLGIEAAARHQRGHLVIRGDLNFSDCRPAVRPVAGDAPVELATPR